MQYMILKVPLHTTKQPVRFLKTREKIIPGFVHAAIQGLLREQCGMFYYRHLRKEAVLFVINLGEDLCVQRGPVDMA